MLSPQGEKGENPPKNKRNNFEYATDAENNKKRTKRIIRSDLNFFFNMKGLRNIS